MGILSNLQGTFIFQGGFRTIQAIEYRSLVGSSQIQFQTTFLRVGCENAVHIQQMLGIGVAQLVVEGKQPRDTLHESRVVLGRLVHPLSLTKGCHSRQDHVFHLTSIGDIFSPKVCLTTLDVLAFLGGKLLWDRLEGIYPAHRQETTNGNRLILLVGTLVIVEIAEAGRCHDDIVVLLGSLDAAFQPSPAHDAGIRCQTTLQGLIPAYHLTAVCIQELLCLMDKVALQLLLHRAVFRVLQPQLLSLGLADWTLLPSDLRALVATHVNHLTREHLYQLGQDTLDEFHSLGITHTKHIIGDAPTGPYFIRTTATAQFRVGAQGSQHVTWHIYLRHDIDIAFLGIFHDFAALLLGVVATIASTVVPTGIMANNSLLTPAAHLCQFRIPLHLKSPALVIGQVPVQAVLPVQGQDVDIAFYEFYREEMARAVEHHTPIFETRGIGNRDKWQLDCTCSLSRQRFPEALDAIEDTGL